MLVIHRPELLTYRTLCHCPTIARVQRLSNTQSCFVGQPLHCVPLKPKTTNVKAHIKSRLTILDQQKLHPASIVHCKVHTVDTAQLDWPAALTMACMPYIIHMYIALQSADVYAMLSETSFALVSKNKGCSSVNDHTRLQTQVMQLEVNCMA